MKTTEFTMLMTEIRDLKEDVKQVRQVDVPGVHTRIAVMEEKMTMMKQEISKEAEKKVKVYSGITSLLAIATTLMMSHFKH